MGSRIIKKFGSMHTHMHTHTRVHTHTYTKYTHTKYTHTHTHTHIHTHTHTHTRIHYIHAQTAYTYTHNTHTPLLYSLILSSWSAHTYKIATQSFNIFQCQAWTLSSPKYILHNQPLWCFSMSMYKWFGCIECMLLCNTWGTYF